jgi:drug/metabolite transporter (DMT)-like permease
MLGELCALAAAVVWALAVILFRRSEIYSPQGLNLFKNTLSLGLMLVTLAVTGTAVAWDRPATEWATLALSGLLGIAVADTLFFMALRRLGPAAMAVVDCAYTPIVALLSALLLGETLSGQAAVGVATVVLGVGLSSVDRGALGRGPAWRSGLVYAALDMLALGLGIILARPILAERPLLEVVVVRMVFGLVGQLAWIALSGASLHAFAPFRPAPAWKTLVPATVLGTWMAMVLWLAGFKWAPAAVAAVLNQSSTIFLLLFSWWFLGERLSRRRLAGAAVALVGVGLILAERAGQGP